MKVITNHVPRDVIDGPELSDVERGQFDYHDWSRMDVGEDSASFMRYKGYLYDLGEFLRVESSELAEKWDGMYAESAFSGVLVKWVGNDQVIVGLWLT